MIDLDKRPAGNDAAWAEIDRLRVAARLLHDLHEARYGVYVITNSLFCGTREQTEAYNAERPARIKAAEDHLDNVWRKAEAFLGAHVPPYEPAKK